MAMNNKLMNNKLMKIKKNKSKEIKSKAIKDKERIEAYKYFRDLARNQDIPCARFLN